MPGVAIVTDTTHYLPRELAERHEISSVSLYVNSGRGQQRESEIRDYGAYYRDLRTAEKLPTTSQPSIGDFLEVWRPLLDAGHHIVAVHLSGGISGTVDAAAQAREQLGEHAEKVVVVDGKTTGGGLGLIALAGAAAARAGANREVVAARIREAREALRIWFAVDTLEYLRRGGRVGLAQAWLGGALKIKPILSLEHEITPVERVRTAGRARQRMVEYMETRRDDGADGWVVQHIQDPERAEWLVEQGRRIFGSEPVFVSEIGPVIGTHVGPGLLGVGGIPRGLLD